MELDQLESALLGISDPDPDTRKGSAFWLGELKDDRAVGPLIAALDDEDADVRAEAANALGSFKDSQAVDALLRKLLDDDNLYVRAAAIRALALLADKRAIPALTSIVDTDLPLRAIAIAALGELGDPSIGAKAINFLKDDDQTEEVYHASIGAIGKLRQEKGIRAIEKFLQRGDFSLANSALIALASIGTQSAKNAIENNLFHLNNFNREIAQRILDGSFIVS